MALITWQHVDGKLHWLDHIPAEWPAQKGRRENLSHMTFWHGREPIKCFCDVEVEDRRMIISYDGKHESANAKNFDIGHTIVSFADDARTIYVPTVQWRGQDGEEEEGGQIDPNEILGEEGSPVVRTHTENERNSIYPKIKKRLVLEATGRLSCEACNFDFMEKYGELVSEFCEVHHNVKIAKGKRITGVKNLVIVCANCHRMIHKSERDGEMLTVGELRDRIAEVQRSKT